MKLLCIVAAILFLLPSALAQNCTTQPQANVQTMSKAGSNAVVGNTTNNTITVNLDGPFTSNTGYVSVFTYSTTFAAPGNNGSYRIISGNGSGTNGTTGATQLVLDASAQLPNPSRTNGGTTLNGGQTGRYVSDLAVIRNSARNYTFQWSTPGFNSDTWVSYSDDTDSNTIGTAGFIWRSGDTVTGVQNHSITVDNLDPYVGQGSPNGNYTFTVWSNCFTNGIPDVSLSVHQPQGILAPNHGGSTNGYTKIRTTGADWTGQALNIFTLAGYNDSPSTGIFIPPQDGSHPGFRTTPGGLVIVPLNYLDTTLPALNATGDNTVTQIVDDWVPASGGVGGLLFTYNKNGMAFNGGAGIPWNGQSIIIRTTGGNLNLYVSANTPASAPCGNLLGAEAVMLDGGTLPACAYPLKITGTRNWANYACGTTVTCGPPGTPATPPANVPVVVKFWVLVFNAAGTVPTGTVGPWINPYTSSSGIPCELQTNISVDKPNAVYSAAGCFNYERGPNGLAGNKFAYQGSVPAADGTPPAPAGLPYGGQEANCTVDGKRSENSYTLNSQPIWFYDAGYVCHMLDVQFPKTDGTNNDESEKSILGTYWEQASFARAMDPTLFASYKITAPAVVNGDPVCTTIAGASTAASYCASQTLTVPGDVSAIQSGLAAGQHFRACINGSYYSGAGTVNSSYGCYVFPTSSPSQAASAAPGGNLPATPATTNVLRSYTDVNNSIHSQPPPSVAVSVDSTCPASGNCSITVPSPPVSLNATGYDVYARNGPTGNFYLQNTGGPIPINTPFTFGTATNPLQTTGTYWQTTAWNGNVVSVIAADNVAHTLTINSNWELDRPIQTYNPGIAVMRQLTGIPADAGTSANTLVCNSCNFNNAIIGGNTGVPNSAVVYCNVTTGDMGAPQYTFAPNRGSLIQAFTNSHTLTLATSINCAPGTNFEIRRRVAPPSGVRIFGWANTPYDVWKRFGNYIGADTVMWLASNTAVTGASPAHCCIFSTDPASRRETALSLLSCHRAVTVLNDLSNIGATTALSPQPNCVSPAAARLQPYPVFSMVENMTGSNYGHGTWIGSFLNGLIGYSLIDWWQDPLMGVQNDPQFAFWTNRLTKALWAYYSLRNSYAGFCQPSWPHEWGYDMESAILGVCYQQNTTDCANCTVQLSDGTTAPVADYWSTMGNMLPMFAFFYQYTGNAQVASVPGMVRWPWQPCYALGRGTGVPDCGSITYGQAYQDMASWIFVHMASNPAWSGAGAKTLGEMGIWQDRAITWMQGNGGAPPSTLTILTSSLPSATIGVAYTASMSASGGTPPYSWIANVLPNGLTMNSAGVISGTPTAYGTTTITFTLTDSASPSGTASTTLPLTVAGVAPSNTYPAYITGVIP